MKKAIGQTVRDLKREVNKKVLKVPGIEQKVLDATSNEPWGPHGSLLADIAMATRNYHEYQMIMAVLWKRINDTGKNWRHVYKALTVLDYLVAHGSERVIDDIREHGYQISSLSEFQYIDSSGRDQGSNVRKKSQSLVALVNDKERIIEVREKAAANRDKFRNTSMGGMYRPGYGGYGDRYDYDRYGSRDDDQNGYGRDREYGYRDDDRYGRYGDSNSRDGDRYGRDYEDRYSRDGYRDDEYSGRSRSIDGDQYGTRSSTDRNRAFDEDGASSQGGGARVDDHSQDGRQFERKFSEQSIGAPPSYAEAVGEPRSPVHSERGGETSVGAAPGSSSPPASNNPNQATSDFGNSPSSSNQNVEAFDDFDPRGSVSASFSPAAPSPAPAPATAVPPASATAEMDLFSALSDSLAIVPATPETPATEAVAHANSSAMPTFAANQSASNYGNQGFDDPFGNGPFRAFSSNDVALVQQQNLTSMSTMDQNADVSQPPSANTQTVTDFSFGDSFSSNAYTAPSISNIQPPSIDSQFLPQELSVPNQDNDILADILPPSGPSDDAASNAGISGQSAQPGVYGQQVQLGANSYGQPAQPSANPYGQPGQPGYNAYGQSAQPSVNPYSQQPAQPSGNPYSQPAQPNANPYGHPAQPNANPYGQHAQQNANPYGQPTQLANPYGQPLHPNSNNIYGNFNPETVSMAPQISASAAQNSNGSYVPQIGSNSHVNSHMTAQPPAAPSSQFNAGNFLSQQGPAVSAPVQSAYQSTNAPIVQNNDDVLSGLLSKPGSNTSMVPQTAPPSATGALAIVPQPSKDKFEPKSAVWADTLSRGLVNLNISGPKINPLADIGVDFDAINRKEKRMEKPSQSAVTSTVTMGKAMGSGSGIGRVGASALRAPANPMIGSGMGMGMGMGGAPGGGMGMGGYGGMNQQPMGMGMGMGMSNMGMNPGMGMNMGMGQGVNMRPQTGMPGSYNPLMGSSGYPQQPYGGGYR